MTLERKAGREKEVKNNVGKRNGTTRVVYTKVCVLIMFYAYKLAEWPPEAMKPYKEDKDKPRQAPSFLKIRLLNVTRAVIVYNLFNATRTRIKMALTGRLRQR